MPTQEQIACIFCGKSVIKERMNLERWSNWDISWVVRQVREILPGPGRGHKGKSRNYGFPAIKSEGLSILGMIELGEYDEYVDAIKNRLIMIVNGYIEAGIINREEIL